MSYRGNHYIFVVLLVFLVACQPQDETLPTLIMLPTESETAVAEISETEDIDIIQWEITEDDVKAYSCESTDCDIILTLQLGNIIEVSRTEAGWHFIASESIEYYIEEQYTRQYIEETEETLTPITSVTSTPTLAITNTLNPSETASATITATLTMTASILEDNTDNTGIDNVSASQVPTVDKSNGNSTTSKPTSTHTPTRIVTAVVISTAIPTATNEILPSPVLPSSTPTKVVIDEVLPTPIINTPTPIDSTDEPTPPASPTLIGANQDPPPPVFPTLVGADQELPPPPELP